MNLILKNQSYSVQQFRALKLKEKWLQSIQQFIEQWYDDKNQLDVPTSGSTGKPKTITFPKSAFLKSAKITNSFFQINASHRSLLCLPIEFIAGKMMVVRAIESNSDLLLIRPSSNPLQAINLPVDFIAMTPYQLQNVVNDSFEKLELVDVAIIGGGAVSKSLQKTLNGRKAKFFQTYGMTETLTHIALQKINEPNRSEFFEVLKPFIITQDERGCLVIEAPHIHSGKVITNDLVTIKGPTSFQWRGRWDNIINSGGIKISPEQVESMIFDLLDVPFFVTGKKDDLLGEKVVLVVESKPWHTLQQDKLMSKLKMRLNKFQLPRSILFLDCFLYTASGKIQRTKTLLNQKSE